MDRDRRLQSSLLQEESVHRRRYVRQVQEELKDRQTEDALLKVHLSVTPGQEHCLALCLRVLTQVQVIRLCVSWQAEEERVNHAKQLEQEERIAKELSRIKYEREREEKMRQYIRENRYSVGYRALIGVTVQVMCCGFLITIPLLHYFKSPELRELEAKLKSAYVNKERAAQIAEQEATRFERMVRTFLDVSRFDIKYEKMPPDFLPQSNQYCAFPFYCSFY